MHIQRVMVLLMAIGLAACSDTADLASFTTDGCSAFPDGTTAQGELWLDCCTRHDVAYWMGGSEIDRRQADEDLKNCVAAVGEPSIAKLMLAGVRVGGTPYLPTQFRWGYGWPFPRGYRTLSDQERAMVDKLKRESTVTD